MSVAYFTCLLFIKNEYSSSKPLTPVLFMDTQKLLKVFIFILLVLLLIQILGLIKKRKNRKAGLSVLRDISRELPYQFIFVSHQLSKDPVHLLFHSVLEMDEVLTEIRTLASCVGYTFIHKQYGYEYSTFCLQSGDEKIHFQLCRQAPLSNSGGRAICMIKPCL
jgi:hypothetical protein